MTEQGARGAAGDSGDEDDEEARGGSKKKKKGGGASSETQLALIGGAADEDEDEDDGVPKQGKSSKVAARVAKAEVDEHKMVRDYFKALMKVRAQSRRDARSCLLVAPRPAPPVVLAPTDPHARSPAPCAARRHPRPLPHARAGRTGLGGRPE